MMYEISPKEAWRRLREGVDIVLGKDVSVIDVRPRGEFIHSHLPGSDAWICITLPIAFKNFQTNGKSKGYSLYVQWECERKPPLNFFERKVLKHTA